MIPVNFDGAVQIGKPETMTDEQCMAIPASYGIDNDGFRYFITAWKPSKEDIEAFQRGEPVWVKVIANGLPPMALFTTDEDGQIN